MEAKMATQEFKMSRARYFSTMLLHDAPWWIAGFILLILAMGLTGAVISWWHAIIMVTLALVVIPFLLWLPYLQYGFKKLTVTNVTPHTLTITGDRLTVSFPESDQKYEVPLDQLKGYKIMPSGVLIPSRHKEDVWIWLQASAFESPEDMKEFLKALYRHH